MSKLSINDVKSIVKSNKIPPLKLDFQTEDGKNISITFDFNFSFLDYTKIINEVAESVFIDGEYYPELKDILLLKALMDYASDVEPVNDSKFYIELCDRADILNTILLCPSNAEIAKILMNIRYMIDDKIKFLRETRYNVLYPVTSSFERLVDSLTDISPKMIADIQDVIGKFSKMNEKDIINNLADIEVAKPIKRRTKKKLPNS